MAEFLSPGVFIEEVSNAPQTIEAVGTSTMAIVGWTPQGVINEATLVTGPDSYVRLFGGNTNQSLVPISVNAYFQNGGTRCYVVRVVPSDSVAATSDVTDTISSENPVFSPAEDGVALGPFTATLVYHPLDSSVITLVWAESTVSKTATITGTSTLGGTNAANLSAGSINRTTGDLSLTFAAGHAPDADSIIVSYVGSIWVLNAANPGAWGNDLKVTVSGNTNFLVYGPSSVTNAGKYTKFDITVLQENTSGIFEIKETYDEVVFDDTTDPMYVTDVINHGSDLISILDMGFLNAPSAFTGKQYSAENIGSGDGTTTTFTHTAANPAVLKASLVVHYTISTVAHTATASADGTISGTGIDSTKTNTINWTTGLVTLNFSTAPDNLSTVTMDYIQVPSSSLSYTFSGGSDGTLSNITNLTVSNFTALKAGKLGMYALDRVDDLMQLIIPDFAGDVTVAGDQIAYAEARRDIFCILTTPVGMTAQSAVDYVQITLAQKSKYAAMYWPWVKVQDPLSATRQITIPALGHIAGIYARTDLNRNVGKAPAGTIDGALRGIVGLEVNPGKEDRDTVYPARINPLINTPQTGLALWGVRTLSATNDSFRYVQATRLFMFVEKSVFNSVQNHVFESINANLYTAIKVQLDSFLLNLYNNGYFAGSTPSQAFIVVCDSTNNPPVVQNAGQVIVDVAIAPNKPGEFLRFRLAEKTIS